MPSPVGNNSHRAPNNGTPPAINGPLSRVPTAVFDLIIRFNPESAPILRVASRELGRNTEASLQQYAGAINLWCSNTSSSLSTLINRTLTSLRNLNGLQSDRINMRFHQSIPEILQSLGIPHAECHNRILSLQEINQFNHRIENDHNLQRAWVRLHQKIPAAHPGAAGVPEVNASAQEIRNWMHAVENQAILQGITELSLNTLLLTCVPKEIALCTALQTLYLHDNQIASFPEGVFQGMRALQSLYLYGNRIASFPEGVFQGLTSLQSLVLSGNLIVTFPEGVFQGLTSLQRLFLDDNRIASFPAGIFQGLRALQALELSSNQITSFPEGVFQGLTSLQRLDLSNNQITSFAAPVFQDLAALQTLRLYGNPRLMISYNDPENRSNNIALTTEFFNYACQSPFAKLYQLAAGGASPEAVRESFLGLSDNIKNAIYYMVWVEAGRPNTDDPQWGEHHTFDDMQRFYGALKRHTRESFDQLTNDQKKAVYFHVYHLAKGEGIDVDSVPEWGRAHAFDNILRLIDAMLLR